MRCGCCGDILGPVRHATRSGVVKIASALSSLGPDVSR